MNTIPHTISQSELATARWFALPHYTSNLDGSDRFVGGHQDTTDGQWYTVICEGDQGSPIAGWNKETGEAKVFDSSLSMFGLK